MLVSGLHMQINNKSIGFLTGFSEAPKRFFRQLSSNLKNLWTRNSNEESPFAATIPSVHKHLHRKL